MLPMALHRLSKEIAPLLGRAGVVLGLFVAVPFTSTTAQPSPASDAAPAYGPELEGFSYPWPVQNFEFVGQGVPLHMAYMDVKPKAPNGHVVVLLHGKNYVA